MNTLIQDYAQADLLQGSEAVEDDVMLRFDDANPLQEDFDEKVKTAQEELDRVRQRADQLERQKNEYEELSQKQERFMRGRTEICDRLSRAFARLDRETHEAQVRIHDLEAIKDAFTRQLSIIEALQPENWPRADLRSELNRALGCIEDAEDEYTRSMERLCPGSANENHPHEVADEAGGAPTAQTMTTTVAMPDRSFSYWVKSGFAFTLPVMAFAFLYLVVKGLFGA